MKLAPAVIIHGLPHAQAALAAGLPVTLLSAPGAGAYAGVGWWRALVAAAACSMPEPPVDDILDCGTFPGRALEALRAGQRLLVLRASPEIFADIAGRAAVQGALILARPPPALDLAQHGSMRALPGWLAGA